jgi:hypothetical protein
MDVKRVITYFKPAGVRLQTAKIRELYWFQSAPFSLKPLQHFLSAFAKLEKATISFVASDSPSVRLSARRMEQHGSRSTNFHEIL